MMITIEWKCWNCDTMNRLNDGCTHTIKYQGKVEYGATCQKCGKKHSVFLTTDDVIREPLDGESE